MVKPLRPLTMSEFYNLLDTTPGIGVMTESDDYILPGYYFFPDGDTPGSGITDAMDTCYKAQRDGYLDRITFVNKSL